MKGTQVFEFGADTIMPPSSTTLMMKFESRRYRYYDFFFHETVIWKG